VSPRTRSGWYASTSPAGLEDEPNFEHGADAPEPTERDAFEIAALDPRIRTRGDPGLGCDESLRPAEAMPDLPEDAPDRQIVHHEHPAESRLSGA
jgi:hypothetical protein